MTLGWRHVVAVVLLVFAWKGSSITLDWPPAPHEAIKIPQPDPALIKWAEPMRGVLPKMLLKDRQYLANFYDALVFVLMRDATRDDPIINTTEEFARFHGGSLRSAIDKENVGKYPGLAEAIDETLVNAVGADIRALDKDLRTRLTAACGVLSWVLSVHGDG